MRIALDAMGGDYAPGPIVTGAVQAVAENPDLTRALCDAKRELIRQLEHQKSAREPMKNRRLRSATIRHPNTNQLASAGR